MLDVGKKDITSRIAKARAVVRCSRSTLKAIEARQIPKGDVLAVARIAAIQAVKDTSRILPLCHPIPIEGVEVEFSVSHEPSSIEINVRAKATWKTGVEMEALCGAMAAALTIYDMCKGLERGISIHTVELIEKEGGRTGRWVRECAA